jgi:hypothetical protein
VAEPTTDAVVPLALVSARPHGDWKEPLLTHVRAPDNQIVAVPRENWVHGGYTREPEGAGTLADTLRERREQRKTERVLARQEAQMEMNRALEKRAKDERLAQLREMEAALQARMAEAKEKLDAAQALSRGAKARVDAGAPDSHKRQKDFHNDGRRDIERRLKKAEQEAAAVRRRALEKPAEVDNRPSLAAEVQRRLAQTATRRVDKRGGQLDGSGWRKGALVAKHDKFVAAAKAGKRPGVDAGDRGGTKRSWLNWEGAGKGGRALAVQQRFARKRPTLQVLARSRREAEAKARTEIGLAARPHGRTTNLRLSLRASAGYRAGYHEHSERGANPAVISPWDAGHRQNVHDRKLAEVRPQTETRLDETIARTRASIASDAATALRQSTGSNWEAEARARDTKQRRPFARTPSAVGVAQTVHDKRVKRAVKEVDAGGEQDKAHAKLVEMGRKGGRGGWQKVAQRGKGGALEGRTVAAVAERAYWHRLRVEQARAGKDNRQALFWTQSQWEVLFGPDAPAIAIATGKTRTEAAAAAAAAAQEEETERSAKKKQMAANAVEEDRLRKQEFGWVAPVPRPESLQRTGTGLFPKAAAAGTPLHTLQLEPTAPAKGSIKQSQPAKKGWRKQQSAAQEPHATGRRRSTKARRKPGWAGARAGGPRDQCPPGSQRRRKGVYLDPGSVAAHMRRYQEGVASARRHGTASLREGTDGTAGPAWQLKENRDVWRQQRVRSQRVFEATTSARRRKIPTSLGGGGETAAEAGGAGETPLADARIEKPLSKWSAAARELSAHRMRVSAMIADEEETDEQAYVASRVPLIRDAKEEAALAVGIYPIGVGEVVGGGRPSDRQPPPDPGTVSSSQGPDRTSSSLARDDEADEEDEFAGANDVGASDDHAGAVLSESEDEEVDRLLLKYAAAAAAAGWQSSDEDED